MSGRISIAVLVALLVVITCHMPAIAAVPEGAVLLLSFDRATIDNGIIKDLSGKENHCQIKGATQTKGVAGEALAFNGKGNVVAIKSMHEHLSANLKGITLSAWVMNAKGDGTGKIFEVGFSADKNISLTYDKSLFAFHMPTSAGGDTVMSKAKADTRWHHVVGVWNGKDQRIYVDGQLSGVLRTNSFTLTPTVVSANTALLGGEAKRSGKAKSRYFKGAMDEVAIFNRALSLTEVYQLFKDSRKGFGQAVVATAAPNTNPSKAPGTPASTPESGNSAKPAKLTGNDPVVSSVNQAIATYNILLNKSKTDMAASIEARIKTVAQTGDLNAVKAVIAQKDAFAKLGTLPTEAGLQAAVNKFTKTQATAYDVLLVAYEEGVKNYTKALKIDEATALQKRLEALKNKPKATGSTWLGKPAPGSSSGASKPAGTTNSLGAPATTADLSGPIDFQMVNTPGDVNTFCVTDDGLFFFCAHEKADKISVYEVATGKHIKTVDAKSPHYMIGRKGLVFVVNKVHATLYYLSRGKGWEVTRSIALKIESPYYISAPQNMFFKSSLIVIGGGRNNRKAVLAQPLVNKVKMLWETSYMGAVTVDFKGKYVITQNEWGHSARTGAVDYRTFTAGTEKRFKTQGGIVGSQTLLFQVRPVPYWCNGQMVVPAGGSPIGSLKGDVVVPDLKLDQFYILKGKKLTAHKFDAQFTEIAERDLANTDFLGAERRFANRSGSLCHPVAVTDMKTKAVYMFIRNRKTNKLYRAVTSLIR
jgi:hypothetical protein